MLEQFGMSLNMPLYDDRSIIKEDIEMRFTKHDLFTQLLMKIRNDEIVEQAPTEEGEITSEQGESMNVI